MLALRVMLAVGGALVLVAVVEAAGLGKQLLATVRLILRPEVHPVVLAGVRVEKVGTVDPQALNHMAVAVAGPGYVTLGALEVLCHVTHLFLVAALAALPAAVPEAADTAKVAVVTPLLCGQR